MPPVKKRVIKKVEEQRNLTTFFSLRDVGYVLVTGVMVASAFFTFGTRISVLEHSEEVTRAAIEEIKQDDEYLRELGAEINYSLADVISKENRLIIDVEKIEDRLRQLEVKGGARN